MSISHRFPKLIKLLKEENINVDLLIEGVEECIDHFQAGALPLQVHKKYLIGNLEYKNYYSSIVCCFRFVLISMGP